MTKAEAVSPNAVIVSKISIERCQNHLAHLRALIHLCEPDNFKHDSLVTESVMRVMKDIEGDLFHSAKALSQFE